MDDLLCNPLPKNRIENKEMRQILLREAASPFARKLRNYDPKAVVVVVKSIDTYVNEAIEKSELTIDAYELVEFPYRRNGITCPQTICEAQHALTNLKQFKFIGR